MMSSILPDPSSFMQRCTFSPPVSVHSHGGRLEIVNLDKIATQSRQRGHSRTPTDVR